jgi:hypothetical protein
VKTIVKSAKYPVDNMPFLWKTITLFHKDEVPEIIKHFILVKQSDSFPKEWHIINWVLC